VGNPEALEIVVDVLTSDAVEIEEGAQVTIDRWGGEQALEGQVRRVEPSAFQKVSALGVEERRVNVLIDLDTPYEKWKQLGDGYRVETRIVVWKSQDVLQVPASAVFRHGDGWAVYRVEKGAARLAPVDIGKRDGDTAQVLEGLDEGQPVVLYPSDRVSDGTEVKRRGQ
jgi:HlyD family secretion protein